MEVERIEHQGETVVIYQEEDAEHCDPRQWDNLGIMVCFHPDYILGDVGGYGRENGKKVVREHRGMMFHLPEYVTFWLSEREKPPVVLGEEFPFDAMDDWEQWKEQRADYGTPAVVLPLILYDHSGLWLSVGRDRWPFNCPWDTSHMGYIVATEEAIIGEYGELTEATIQKAEAVLRSEVAVYSAWLEGNVYGWAAEVGGEVVDGCGGYICGESLLRGQPSDYENMVKEAKSAAEYYVKQEKERATIGARTMPIVGTGTGLLDWE
tara:strand:+ start:5378 stop:6172 length:795 start_codon:yes stop_codon:yes gene_type:complete